MRGRAQLPSYILVRYIYIYLYAGVGAIVKDTEVKTLKVITR